MRYNHDRNILNKMNLLLATIARNPNKKLKELTAILPEDTTFAKWKQIGIQLKLENFITIQGNLTNGGKYLITEDGQKYLEYIDNDLIVANTQKQEYLEQKVTVKDLEELFGKQPYLYIKFHPLKNSIEGKVGNSPTEDTGKFRLNVYANNPQGNTCTHHFMILQNNNANHVITLEKKIHNIYCGKNGLKDDRYNCSLKEEFLTIIDHIFGADDYYVGNKFHYVKYDGNREQWFLIKNVERSFIEGIV
jgi:hypothetical protein